MFDLQRSVLKQNQRSLQQGIDLQKQAVTAFANSLDAQRSAHRQTVEVGKSAVDVGLNAIESSLPPNVDVDDVRESIDEQYEALDEINDQSWDSFERSVEDATGAFEEMSEGYRTIVDDSFDALIRVHDGIEAQAAHAVEAVEAGAEQAVDVE